MITNNKNIKKVVKYILTLIFILLRYCFIIYAQNNEDSLKQNSGFAKPSIKVDTLLLIDTIPNKDLNKTSDYALESKVEYKAKDSISFDISEQKVYMFVNGEIKYEDITLKADYIEVFFKNDIIQARGMADTNGLIKGKPDYTDASSHFVAETIKYSFKTKKGFITNIVTEQGDGFMQGAIVKKLPDNSALFKNGIYTTCDYHEDPHFCIHLTKAKVIPNDKIVSGPAYLVIESVPTPLAIPFGFFPNKKGRTSGILIPAYGESANRGFFLENGGYYFAINDYIDLALRGDIYSRGSWAVKVSSSYNKRYKYNGNININYAENYLGERELPDSQHNKDFFIKWSHNQDQRARPNSRFSANVNAGSSSYNTYNPSSASDYLTNTFQSNISYQAFIARKYNFSANFRHSQNTLTHIVDLNLPEIAFSTDRFYPFRKKNKIGENKWYENISLTYSMNAQNRISSLDSLIFSNNIFKRMQNGVHHNIPVYNSFKIFKYFTLNNLFVYNEKWYLQTIKKAWFNNLDTAYLKIDTINGFKAARDFSFSSTINTRIYGMYKFNKGPIIAIRHVVSPAISFSWHPDFSKYYYGYYYYTLNGNATSPVIYSIFENGIYGYPQAGRSGIINFAIANNVEMKINSKKDSINGIEKIILIENFTISSAYDMAKDSLNWSNLVLSGRTRLFKDIDIRYTSIWSPYITDSLGRLINTTVWENSKHSKIFSKSSSEWALSLNWNLSSKTFKPEKNKKDINKNNFSSAQPWDINFSYT
ncbi:MAG TPA: putative LPS assembly protein LptD, partial [Bacteroidales bacterium]|nr:putative LPS assembly protein LptD [Bacteroidales bacterium]